MQKIETMYVPARNSFVGIAPEFSDKTESGVIKPDSMVKEEMENWDGGIEVLITGPKCEFIKVGYKAFIAPGAPYVPVKIGGKNYIQFDEFSVTGYIKNQDSESPQSE